MAIRTEMISTRCCQACGSKSFRDCFSRSCESLWLGAGAGNVGAGSPYIDTLIVEDSVSTRTSRHAARNRVMPEVISAILQRAPVVKLITREGRSGFSQLQKQVSLPGAIWCQRGQEGLRQLRSQAPWPVAGWDGLPHRH